jgi:5-methylcytosine-specific restriction endonuclease McrA
MPDLPKPERRRSFKQRDVDNRFTAQAGRCNKCQCDLNVTGFERDHIQRHDALGKTDYDNLQLLCPPCHAYKSRLDNREAKKGRRIRGENKPSVKKAIPSRGFSTTLRRRMDGTTERK